MIARLGERVANETFVLTVLIHQYQPEGVSDVLPQTCGLDPVRFNILSVSLHQMQICGIGPEIQQPEKLIRKHLTMQTREIR